MVEVIRNYIIAQYVFLGYGYTCSNSERLADQNLGRTVLIIHGFIYNAMIYGPPMFCWIIPIVYWEQLIITLEFIFQNTLNGFGIPPPSVLQIVLFLSFILIPLAIYYMLSCVSRILPFFLMSSFIGLCGEYIRSKKLK